MYSQQILSQVWYGRLENWPEKSLPSMVFHILVLLIMVPVNVIKKMFCKPVSSSPHVFTKKKQIRNFHVLWPRANSPTILQVNLCQKHLFLDQLTHNMTKDCSLIYQFSTCKLQAQNMGRTCCVHKLFECQNKNKKQFVCTTCSTHVLSL